MLATKNYVDFQILDSISGSVLAEWKGAERANRALPEDRVRMTGQGSIEILERAARRPLVGVLQLTSKYMYGMTSHGVPLYSCQPLNKGYPCFRVACKERDRSQNLLVSFQFENWESGSELPRGSLLKILGPVEDVAAEAEALGIVSCPWSAPRPESESPAPTGRYLLSSGTFNIDPPGCLDIDDVITIKELPDSRFQIWITIADVSEVVRPGTKIFEVAQKIGATSYQDGRAVRPMLHRDLSEKVLSLLPGELRFGLALRVEFDILTGKISSPEFQKVLVKNQRSFTYESVLTEGDKQVCDVLRSFSSSEDPHKWIEHCMLLYNREAAKVLAAAGCGLLRAHDAPFQEQLEILSKIDPSLQYLAYQSANYASVGAGGGSHWGLGESLYCHASSPLRRFADLINQQILKDYLEAKPCAFGGEAELAVVLNRRQKQIQAAERNFHLLKAIQTAERAVVQGTFLWTRNGKAEVYVRSWESTIRFVCEKDLIPGKTYEIQYYCDRRKATWKERMIYRLTEANSDEQ
jgi:exoribonuclease R